MEGNLEEKLTKIFQICSKSHLQVKDDTCIKKLNSFIELRLQSPQTAERYGALAFLKSVITNHDEMDPSTIDFSIHLAGCLACQNEIYKVHGNCLLDFFTTVQSQYTGDDLSVLTSLYQVMRKLICSSLGEVYLTKLFSDEFLRFTWKQLESGRSIFLSNSIVHFMAVYLSRTSGQNFSIHDGRTFLMDHVLQTLSDFSQDLKNPKKTEHNLQLIKSCIELIMKEPLSFVGIGTDGTNAESLILNIMKEGDADVLDIGTHCLSAICKCSAMRNKDHILSRTDFIKEMASLDIIRTLKICAVLFTQKALDPSTVDEVFLYPLYLVCDMEIDSNPTVVNIRTLMSSRQSCHRIVHLALQCLQAAHSNTHQDLVIRVIALTVEIPNPKSVLQNYIAGNKKIQHKCLDILNKGPVTVPDTQAISVILRILEDRPEHMTYSKCLEYLQHSVGLILHNARSDNNEEACSFVQSLTKIVQFQMCSVQWEFRDTTLEFLSSVIHHNTGQECLQNWLESSRLLLYIYQALSDGDSYVRASALSCLQNILLDASLRTLLGTTVDLQLDEMIKRVLEIVSNDTEAFPRRAGVQLMSECWTSLQPQPTSMQEEVFLCFAHKLPADFDWEVKLKVIEFWDRVIRSELDKSKSATDLPSYAKVLAQNHSKIPLQEEKSLYRRCLEKFGQIGLFDSLFKLLEDYDQSVCKQTCTLLLTVKSALLSGSYVEGQESDPSLKSKVETSQDTDYCGNFAEKICDMYSVSDSKVREVLTKIESLDLEAKLLLYSDTCDEYDRNPESLLDDILSYCEIRDDSNEDNAIDCY